MAAKEEPPFSALDLSASAAENGQLFIRKNSKLALSGGNNLGMSVAFKDLKYSVPSSIAKGERAYLLKSVSGHLEPGKMAALMGPSGSGKTTLLDVLAGRKTTGTIEGDLRFAGHVGSREFLRRYTGYVEQFDTLLPILTVYEMLLYTAELKREISEPLADKRAAVDELLKRLALDTCRDVKIGNQMARGISGGQAKRTNIGIALITNPKVIFLDEPTSGLDSYTSNQVMTLVKSLALDGTTVCATIHSPTAYCFSLFDSVMMLVRGQCVYFGSNGAPMTRFVHSAYPEVKAMTPGYNEAEWLVDMVTEADRQNQGPVFAEAYNASPLRLENMAVTERHLHDTSEIPPETLAQLQVRHETVTPWWWALWILIKYRTTRNYKDGAFLGPRIGDKIFVSLLVLTLYQGIGDELYPTNYINISAVLFMWAVMPAFGAAAYVPSLVLERGLYVRERNDGLYAAHTYLIAKMFDELVVAVLGAVVVSAWVFYAIQFQGNFACFFMGYFGTLSVGIILAYFIASIAPNLEVANAVLPTYVVTFLFFAGFLFRLENIPKYWRWYSYVEPLTYSWGAMMANQFEANDPVWIDGQTVLQYYGLKYVDKWAYIGYLSLFFFVFFMLTWTALRFKNYQQR